MFSGILRPSSFSKYDHFVCLSICFGANSSETRRGYSIYHFVPHLSSLYCTRPFDLRPSEMSGAGTYGIECQIEVKMLVLIYFILCEFLCKCYTTICGGSQAFFISQIRFHRLAVQLWIRKSCSASSLPSTPMACLKAQARTLFTPIFYTLNQSSTSVSSCTWI